jgi:hypothetical protein
MFGLSTTTIIVIAVVAVAALALIKHFSGGDKKIEPEPDPLITAPGDDSPEVKKGKEYRFDSYPPEDDPVETNEPDPVTFDDADPDSSPDVDPEPTISREVPGIGDKLEQRIVDALDIRTPEELEEAARNGDLKQVEGFSTKRTDAILAHFE